MLKTIGIDEAYYLFHVLDLHDGERPSRYYGPCMALGCMPTSLEQLVHAYGALANEGILQALIWYREQALKPPVRILSENSARHITLFLSDPMARLPAFPRMGSMEYPFPVALKTGTSQGYRDAWALAYSRDYLVGVWVGRADWKSMNCLGGAGSAASLAKKIILHLHPHLTNGMADLSFPPPEGYRPIEICTYTGQNATGVCESTLHFLVNIDTRNGLLATNWTPKEMVEERSFINLPSRYNAWAAMKGVPVPPTVYSPLDLPAENSSIAFAWPLDGKLYTLRGEKNVNFTVTSPEDGLKLLNNPEIPAALNSLARRVNVDPGVPQVVWYVDGRPFKLVEAPYVVRWPLQQGNHTFQVRLPFRDEASGIMQVTVE
jgi:penicillin-binding protein 1C